MTVRYWIYRSLKGSGLGNKRMRGLTFDKLSDAEAAVRAGEKVYPNAEFTIIKKIYGEEEE